MVSHFIKRVEFAHIYAKQPVVSVVSNHNNEKCFEQGNPRKFSWAPCPYCLKLGYKSAPNHSSDRCKLDPLLSAKIIQSMITTSNKSVVKQMIKELKSKDAKPSKKDE